MDGVILRTNLTKYRAMLGLFAGFPGHLERISQYILERNGVRRDLKILGIHSEILGSPLSHEGLEAYLRRYAVALEDELSRAPLVDGVDRFIEAHPGKLFVNSSAPPEEVERQLDARGLMPHFDGVFAGEADKREALAKIRLLAEGQAVVFFGDSLGDWHSARSAGIPFVGVVAERDNFGPAPIAKIQDFADAFTLGRAIQESLAARKP